MMSDEQQTDPLLSVYHEQQLALEDALQRRRTAVQLDETEKREAAKKLKDMGKMSNRELNDYTRQFGFDAI